MKRYFEQHPLRVIILLALVLRLFASFFSKGFGMHDDHFLVIEPAQAWVDQVDFAGWMPMFKPGTTPQGHSLLYPGLHYLLFRGFEFAGIRDPQSKMLLVRLIHTLFSLIVVCLGFKICDRMGSRKAAITTGMLLAAFWFMPFLSVRNLVEMVCIPFLMLGLWSIIGKDEPSARDYLIAGLWLGIAFSFRFQTLIFSAGIGLGLLILKRWKGLGILCLGYLAALLLIQGGIDVFIWGKPFMEFREYVTYNMNSARDYINNPWYTYILLVSGLLIPPVSLFLLAGFFRLWRSHLLIFLPTLLFFLFHSIFPNKQERFILPAIPFIIMLGSMGWCDYIQSRKLNHWSGNLVRGSWVFFILLNLLMLVPVTLMYSKKARVESMTYLSRYPGIRHIVIEDSNHRSAKMLPEFYLGQWVEVTEVSGSEPLALLAEKMNSGNFDKPRFVLFMEADKLDSRLAGMKTVLPGLKFEACIEPGFMDKLLHWLNPLNTNQSVYIYQVIYTD